MSMKNSSDTIGNQTRDIPHVKRWDALICRRYLRNWRLICGGSVAGSVVVGERADKACRCESGLLSGGLCPWTDALDISVLTPLCRDSH